MADPKKMLQEFNQGMGKMKESNGEEVEAFMNLLGACDKDGAVDSKTKELISIAIAVVVKCKYCIVFHVHEALEEGATPEEIKEAAMVGVTFGGGPAMTYAVTLLQESIEAFSE